MKFSSVMVYILDAIFKENESGGLFGSMFMILAVRQGVKQRGVAVLSNGVIHHQDVNCTCKFMSLCTVVPKGSFVHWTQLQKSKDLTYDVYEESPSNQYWLFLWDITPWLTIP